MQTGRLWQVISRDFLLSAGVALVVSFTISGCQENSAAPVTEHRNEIEVPAVQEVRGTAVPQDGDVRVPPRIEAVIIKPETPTSGDVLQVYTRIDNARGDTIHLDYEWYSNGEFLVGQFDDTLAAEHFSKGDRIEVVATPRDFHNRGEPVRSSPVFLKNRRPEILSEPVAFSGHKFTYAIQAKDEDGDELHYSLERSPPGMIVDAVSGVLEWQVPEALAEPFQVVIHVSDGEDHTSQEFTISPP